MDSRQIVLQSVKKALENAPPSGDVFSKTGDELTRQVNTAAPAGIEQNIERFKNEILAVSGEFISVASKNDVVTAIESILQQESADAIVVAGSALIDRVAHGLEERAIRVIRPEQLVETRKTILATVAVGLVEAAYAVADSGTLAVPFTENKSLMPHFLPETVIALVFKKTLLSDHFELFKKLTPEQKKNMMLVTGPSRTADIEKILILGAHGPRRLIVLLLSDESM